MVNNDFETIWNNTLKLLQSKEYFDEAIINTVFEGTVLYQFNTLKALVSVPTQLACTILNSEKDKIEEALKEASGITTVSLDFILADELNRFINISEAEEEKEEAFDDNLNPEFRFDNFVQGPSNRESYYAAFSCTSKPDNFLYSPLYIYGNSGLGKTHLLHAIGNQIKANFSEKKILYMTSDDFISEVVTSSHNNTLAELKKKLMNLDVFLLDDIQFLAGGKEKSSETLFNIYNQLHKNKKLIVITSDKKPWEIKELEDRLVSRLSNGLTCCIESPEYETAVEILKMKIHDRAEDINIDDDVLSFLATNYSHDVRALEGSLTRLIFYSLQFSDNNTIDINLAHEAFKDDITYSNKNELSILKIQKTVSDYYGISKAQLISKTKTKNISDARAIAIYLCRKHLDVSFTRIGNEFGRRDHSTIMTSYNKIFKAVDKDIPLKIAIEEIEKLMLD